MTNEITVERLLELDIPELTAFNKDIVMVNNFNDMSLFSHPVRLKATTVLVCVKGTINCSINLRNFIITENQMLVNFPGDIIHINSAKDMAGYAIILSEDFLQQIQLDFRFRAQSYLSLRDNGPISIPVNELTDLKPYYSLMKKNMEEGNLEVIKGLAVALAHTIVAIMKRFQKPATHDTDKNETRFQQIFDRFMMLLNAWHTKERSLSFYADKMHLTPKYVSAVVKTYSGKSALSWINEYVVLEAKMMLRYSDMTVQEIAYSLNFPTQSAFGKYFRQQLGVSPKQYRQNKQ